MATVAVTIAGRSYRVACEEGEEAHLQQLARHVDQTLSGMRRSFGEVGDTRLIVMAALTIADELSEAKQRIADLEALHADRQAARADSDALALEVADLLGAASERIERLAVEIAASEDR